MRFTPGPWAMVDATMKRFDVRIIHAQTGTLAKILTPRSWDEAKATGRLIAEAPLLHQLVLETFTPGWERDNAWIGCAHAILGRIGGLR